MLGDWCNISQKYRKTPFPLCPFPFTPFPPLLSPFTHSFCLSFLFVPLTPHQRIMLLWPVVTLLNYICSQWSVIAIRLLTRERSRIDVSIRSASIVSFPLAVHVSPRLMSRLTLIIFKSISNDLLRLYRWIKSLKSVLNKNRNFIILSQGKLWQNYGMDCFATEWIAALICNPSANVGYN